MNRLMGLFTLANYKFWDRTASHHWIRKSLLTLGAITVMGVFSAGPVIRQFHAEHPKKGYGAATLSNIELLPVPNGTTVLQRLDELKEALDDARRLGSGTASELHRPIDNTRAVKNEPLVTLIFRDSRYLTPQIQEIVQTKVDSYHNYLVGLNIKAPSDMPPIGVRGT
jgi:hypothetical protein